MFRIESYALLLLLSLSFMQSGCKKKTVEQPAPEDSQPFKITITQSGGFAGSVEGYTISHDGKIEKFEQMPGREKNVLLSATAKKGQAKEYREWLESSGLLNKELNEKGNMTTTVRYETADTSYVWSFPANIQAGSPESKKLSEWCTQAVNSIENQK